MRALTTVLLLLAAGCELQPTPPPAATRHAYFSYTDFYHAWTPALRDSVAAHYQQILSGNAAEWRAREPQIRTLRYTLEWSTIDEADARETPQLGSVYLADMRQWFARHPEYDMERAFLHQGGADSAHRINPHVWNTTRFVGNPSDPGWIAYTLDRYRRILADTLLDGVFLDEMSSTPVAGIFASADEFPHDSLTPAPWEAPQVALLAMLRDSLAPKIVMVNPAEYRRPFDSAMVVAAGAAHLEKMDGAMVDVRTGWALVEEYLAAGVAPIDYVARESWADYARGSTKYPPGLYSHSVHRLKMAQYAAYLMVLPDSAPWRLLYAPNGDSWSIPPDSMWLRAYQYDLGRPIEARRVLVNTRDALDQPAVVYGRSFEHAVVYSRPQTYWGATTYTDTTAVAVPLPAGGPWAMLNPDGTRAPLDSLRLRNSEAVILVPAGP